MRAASKTAWLVVRSEEVVIEAQCLLQTAAAVRQKERGSESERTSIRLSRSMLRALSGEHSRKREDHSKEGHLWWEDIRRSASLCLFPGACTFLSVSLNPLSDVVLQRMSTLNLGLLLVMAVLL